MVVYVVEKKVRPKNKVLSQFVQIAWLVFAKFSYEDDDDDDSDGGLSGCGKMSASGPTVFEYSWPCRP